MTPAPAVQPETWTPAPAEAPANKPAAASPTSATLRVLIPDDAALSVGDFQTQSTGGLRHFESPPLTPGKTYAYELAAEVLRDGRIVRETKTVVVTAGQAAEVNFALEETQVAQASER